MDQEISLEVDKTLPPDQECSGDNEVNSATSHSEETRQISSSGSRNNSSNDPSSIATTHESRPSDVSNINENNNENFSYGGNGHEDVSDNKNKENCSNEESSSDEKNKENVCMDGGTTDKNVSSNNRNEDGNNSSDDGDDDESGGTNNSEEETDYGYPLSEGELDPMPELGSTSEESATVENLATSRAVQEQGVLGNSNTVDNNSNLAPKDGSDSQQKNSENSRSNFPLCESEESEKCETVSGMPQSMGVQCVYCTVLLASNASVCETCGFRANSDDSGDQLIQIMEEERAIIESCSKE